MESGRRDRKAEQSEDGEIPVVARFALKDRQCEFAGCVKTHLWLLGPWFSLTA